MNLANILESLREDPDRLLRLKEKRSALFDQITEGQKAINRAQFQLDTLRSQLARKRHAFELTDRIIAEHELIQKQQAEQAAKLKAVQVKRIRPRAINKTMEDIVACLQALPKEQREAVLEAMRGGN